MDSIDISSYDSDPTLYLFTSLTAGSSHIISATSRMETILKANRIPFLAIDTATDERARKLWGRRAGKKKLPGLVKEGYVLGDLEDVEEWNEFGELKENIGPVPQPVNTSAPPPQAQRSSKPPTPSTNSSSTTQASAKGAMPGANSTKTQQPMQGASEVEGVSAATSKEQPLGKDGQGIAEAVSGKQDGEGARTQEQPAKEADLAGDSVED
ncbi:hypothetical protein B0A49_04885 [Cryomyces minteri]|uniref:Uncharacterized protein n=2 Tax=Cryomyces minteri TaxID=331657 RepID=A0A4U0XCD6_9PEZI|nr:hypothetical protein B0A49_04885 [Cryomyces minteri]